MRAVNYARNQVHVLIEQGTIAADRWSRLRGCLGIPCFDQAGDYGYPAPSAFTLSGSAFRLTFCFWTPMDASSILSTRWNRGGSVRTSTMPPACSNCRQGFFDKRELSLGIRSW